MFVRATVLMFCWFALLASGLAAPRVVILHGESEYGSQRTMPALADALRTKLGYEITLLTSPEDSRALPDLTALEQADLLILYLRFREATEEQMAQLQAYFDAGKPAIAFRTTSHAFWEHKGWFPPIFGGHYKGHGGNSEGTTVVVPGSALEHPIVAGLAPRFDVEYGGTYNAQPLSDLAQPILFGKTRDLPAEPVAWIASPHKAQRLFYTSLGAEENFESPHFQKLISNACEWCLGEGDFGVPSSNATSPAPPERDAAPDARVLFAGENLDQWRHWDPSTPPKAIGIDGRADTTSGGPVYDEARWTHDGKAIVARPGYGDILTRASFTDSVYELDFLIPNEPKHLRGQFRGNSGVYIDGKWEIQIIDSYGSNQLDDKLTCGAIYGVAAPSVNACGKPGTWQNLQVAVKHVDENSADLSVWLNGTQIHDRVRVEGRTLYGFEVEEDEDEADNEEDEEDVGPPPVPLFVSTEAQGKQCAMDQDFTAIVRFRTGAHGPLFGQVSPDGDHRENDKVLYIEDERLHYDIGYVGVIAADTEVTDNEWHTVALRQKGEAVEMFLDGEKILDEEFTSPDNEVSVMRVAAGANNFPEGRARRWDGFIESFQFFDQALTDQDIELTGGSEPIERAKPVLSWKGDPEMQTSSKEDESAKVDLGGEYSVAVRFRTFEGGPLFAKAPEEGNWARNGKVLFVRGRRLVYDIGWLGALPVRGMKVNDGNWHIAVVTHKEGTTRIYVDGKKAAERSSFTRPDDEAHVFKIGGCSDNFPPGPSEFEGHLAELLVFNRELSRREAYLISEGDFDEGAVVYHFEDGDVEDEELKRPEGGTEGESPELDAEPENEEPEETEQEESEEEETEVSGPLRLQADSSEVRFANVTVRPLADVDHASIITAWDDAAFKRGQKIYAGICFACHGNLQQKGSLPTSRPFWEEPFKNGKDPHSLYLTLKNGYEQMPPQPWLTPSAAYDVIHYIREEFVKENNASEYTEITDGYLASLPKGMGTEGKLTQEQIDYARGPKYLRMNFGPMLDWTFQVAPENIAYKGIAVRLDDGPGGVSKGRHWIVYDHDTMRVAAAWSGNKFVDWKGIAFDQSHNSHTSIVGDKTLVNPVGPGWAHPETGSWSDPRFLGRDGKPYGPLPRDWVQFKGQYVHGNKVVLKYTVGDAEVLEMPSLVQGGAQPVFARTLNIGKSSQDLRLRVSPAEVTAQVLGGTAAVEVMDGYQVVTVLAKDTPLKVNVLSTKAPAESLTIAALLAAEAEDLTPYTTGGPTQWTETVVTEGKRGNDEDPFAVDEITYPAENPYHSWMRIGGFDFLPGGKRAAVATWLGDVWLVDGIDSEFGQHEWKRICTGLFQPLGVKVVDGTIYVTCRDQIAKLNDLNGDEEIDYVECFNNDHQVTEHFHEFAMGLQTDEAGNFYYAKSARHALKALVPHHGTLLRVSKDGSRTDILATGFRAANGVCLNPDGTYIVTDQEGHWNPKNRINYVKEGGFYGNMYGYHDVTDSSDDAMEQPLCWITNAFDRSPGELLWVPEDAQWGALNGQLLNLSYGRGRVFVVPHEKLPNGQAQGGMVSLGLDFPTGIMRGRFHSDNGQLYTTGMFAWAGSKHQDGGFYRVRATGVAPNLPVALKAHPEGIELGFTDPLDKKSAQVTDNYRIKFWGLKRTKNYGSKHYDERSLDVTEATVSGDGKTVFLTIPEIKPTWCMEIKIDVTDEKGKKVEHVIHNTIHQLGGVIESPTSATPATEDSPETKKQAAVDPSNVRSHAIGLLEKHCLECHDSAVGKGDLDIETALDESPLVKSRHLWVNVLERIRNGEMPPADEPQPTEAERQALVNWINREVIEFDYTKVKHPGFERARRLSHAEYNNTVRDLFDIDIRPADQFPHDLSGISGFSNSANTLFIQPTLLERYIGAAEEVVTAALPDWPLAQVTAPDKLFRTYLRQAYRRPPSDVEVSELVSRYNAARELGMPHVNALKPALIFSLISPHFLFRIESAPASTDDHRITDWELASRLSYFIWASTPDKTLLDLAAAGKLLQPDILQGQVQRMLRDDRSRALGHEFASQWLKFEHVGTRVRLDPIDSPWCTDSLMKAMRDESALFIHSLVQENKPIHRLINANYTYLNEELAQHYLIKGIRGEHMRRVTLNDHRRGGIFGHGSVLAVTSFPGRTSPVVRGTYILDDILGTPPPPPPPDAGELEDEDEGGRKLTLKQKLEIHRGAPQCAGCHAKIDPLGLSLENYDWFGRYRDRHQGKPIDSEGQLPNGHQFSGLSGLREVIITQRLDDLTRQITRKMLSFGLGRQLEYYDELATQQILAAVKKDDYRFHTLINEIVNSYPFQWKRLSESSSNS